jgi:NADH pyrophosphatase NudC (nudix superfamily)
MYFFQARYLGGEPRFQRSQLSDFAWVTRAELQEYMPADYYEFLSAMLFK